ncbi:MAG TPA: glycerophosphodiester phosphodiesterase family protein [Microbacteriaceae bacterium]|nr:glycerophosphodiester phosphodiesterase family protein [Microbacteriaceae bacterium]
MTAQIIAHRGASGYRPEHTQAAYELAFRQGVDAVEPDLVLSRDGVVVIRHEHELSRTTDVAARPEFAARRRTGFGDEGPVVGWFTEDFDWEELATLRAREPHPELRPLSAVRDGDGGILRFSDVLSLLGTEQAVSAAGAPTRLVAELKSAAGFAESGLDLPSAVRRDLERAGWAPDDPRLVIESFEADALHALDGWGTRVLLVEEAHWPLEGLAAADPFDGLSCETERILTDPDIAHRLHERGKLAYAYTLRAENAWLPEAYRSAGAPSDFGRWRPWFERVIAAGFDAVFADQPDLALEAVRGRA